MVHCLSSYSS